MPTLVLINTIVQEITASHTNHAGVGNPQYIACTSVADATTKLQTALTPLVGSGNASTHATAFSTRQAGNPALTTHAMLFGNGQGAVATYKP
jgi:hypothetical protein